MWRTSGGLARQWATAARRHRLREGLGFTLTPRFSTTARSSRSETPAAADITFQPDSQPLDSQTLPHESATLTPSQLDAQVGDYPTMPLISMQRRSEREHWWDAQDRRNFGETLPEEEEVLSVWAPDITPAHTSPSTALAHQGIFVLCISLFGAFLYFVGSKSPAVPREYPYDGLLHELSGTRSDDYKYLAARTVGQGQAEIEAAKKAAKEAAEAAEEDE